MPDLHIRPLHHGDREWLSRFVAENWGTDKIVVHGVTYHPCDLPGFVAVEGGERIGSITYHIEGDSCEIVTLGTTRPSIGAGTALIEAVKETARQAGCRRLWVITTNDNIDALRFYQKRGFVLVAVHRGAVEEARKIKPEIPRVGSDGIPLRDEIELEMPLDDTE